MSFPQFPVFWLIDPLFRVMLGGNENSSISDAEFCPVQIGLAVACGLSLFCIIPIVYCGIKKLRKIETDENSTKTSISKL